MYNINNIPLKEFTINSQADQLPLSMMYAEASSPRGILQCCHGMTEHKERYIPFLQYMAAHGYHCFIHDMRGHGKSLFSEAKEDLGYFYENGAKACISDLRTINNFLHEKYPDLPIYLFGHSMGSLEVRAYCKKYDSSISGLIVSGSPAYTKNAWLGKAVMKTIAFLRGEKHRSYILNELALGAYNRPFSKESISTHNWLSTDKDNVINYDKDPLCGFIFTVNGFAVLMDLMNGVYTSDGWECSNPGLPILFISGEDDPCRRNDAGFYHAIDSMKKVGYSRISSHLYPEMRHELLNEKAAQMVMSDILAQLDEWNRQIPFRSEI